MKPSLENSKKKSFPWENWIYHPSSWFEPLSWEKVFLMVNPSIHIDLGAGDGGFILARAQQNPQTYFLAVERLLGRVRKIAKGGYRQSLRNLTVLRMEAAYAVQYLFPRQSVDSITILFPDPWPKRRHHKNRLIQISFLEHCARCLKPKGWLAIKTDDSNYAHHIEKILQSCKIVELLKNVVATDFLPEQTDFERDFLKKGRPIYFFLIRPCL